MNEQLPPETRAKPNTYKKIILRLILLVLLILTTAYLLKTYDVAGYLKKDTPDVKPATPVLTPPQAMSLEVETQVKEALFLTRIASEILHKDHYVNYAKDLLVMAQNRLNGLQGEKIEHARYVINTDIIKLNALQPMDVKVLQEKLATLDKLIAVLPLKYSARAATDNTATQQEHKLTTQDSKWFDMLSEVKSVIKIRKKPADGTPYAPDMTLDIKRAQFKLLIEEVRWALLYNEVMLYKASLAKAIELLPEVFDIHSESVQKFAKTLDELAQVDLNSAIPNIQNSVNALEAIN